MTLKTWELLQITSSALGFSLAIVDIALFKARMIEAQTYGNIFIVFLVLTVIIPALLQYLNGE
jgi:hypothetical protein